MVFSRIPQLFHSVTPPKSSTTPVLPPLSNSRHKNSLRPSSSLQDFSKYNRLYPEEPNLRFSNSGTKTKPPKSRKWVVVLLCFLFFGSIIYGSLHFFSNSSQQSTRFFVVLDCGSTGTRVFVYQASINSKKDQNFPILLKSIPDEHLESKPSSQSGRAYNRKETEPGFDKLVHNLTGLTQAINPLLTWAEAQIPKPSLKSTSLFLYATAGVRRLASADSDWLLNNAYSIIKNSSNFVCEKDWVKTISGREEALYGWIALNYHNRMLEGTSSYGALDLGGSSLQVTFETYDEFETNNETTLKVNVGPVNHRLTAYSLSGYGLNDAFDKSVVHLLKTSRQAVVHHPCLQSGYDEEYICSQCPGRKVLGSNGKKTGVPVRLIGDPNWEECNKLAKITVNSSELSNKQAYGQFYAMSGFYVVYRFFNLSADSPLDEVLTNGQKFCEKTWENAKNSVPAQPFIEQYCFRSPYVVFLLRDGLRLQDNQVNIGSGGITWTTGVALLEAGKVVGKVIPTRPWFYDYKLFKIGINSIHPAVIIAILLFSLCLVVFLLMPRRMNSNLPLFRQRNVPGSSVLNNISSPFSYRRWSPIKMPLSPVARGGYRPFGSNVQLVESALYPSSRSIPHSVSSGSLGQMRLQSRRSQSREDLVSSLADTHSMKV